VLPYICRGCSSAFTSYDSIKRHLKISHENNMALAFYDKTKDADNPWIDP
jgi:hypothetical protein